MALTHSPSIATDGIAFCVDPGNTKSYPGSGTAYTEISGAANVTGTLINTISYGNNFFNFTATNSARIDFPVASSVNITNNITIDMWINPTSIVNIGGVVTLGTGAAEQYAVWTSTSGNKLVLSTNWPNTWYQGFTTTALTNGSWQHMCCTFASGTWTWYRNGVSDGTGTFAISTFPTVASGYVVIGDNHPGGQEYFDGKIGPIKIYNRVLTAAEIRQNFNAYRGRFGI